MANDRLEAWKIVSTRIESFDKLVLDVRLRVLGYSAIAVGVVETVAHGAGDKKLDDSLIVLLLGFIALTIAAVAITDATYYYQLLIGAVIVAMRLEARDKSGVLPRLHSTIKKKVDPIPWLLYFAAYGAPAAFLVALMFGHNQRGVGYCGVAVWLAVAVIVVRDLSKANRNLAKARQSALKKQTG